MQCPECDTEVREFEWHCTACNHDCGYPNVRAAQKPEELAALARRVQAAEMEAAAKGTTNILDQFRQAMRDSKAVLCRSLSKTTELASSDNELYASFYQLVSAGVRRPEDTETDRERLVADVLLFPYYHDEIRFAALSLDDRGVNHYGECSIVFRDKMIRSRATVFEENSLYFSKKCDLGTNRPVPPGYRATWDQRDQVAVAKLGAELSIGMQEGNFPRVLLKNADQGQQEEFIEVHIYGPLHRQSIEQVIARQPKRKADRVIVKELERKLSQMGARFETDK